MSVRLETAFNLTFARVPAAAATDADGRVCRPGRRVRDQVADYARRKGMSLHEADRWLAPNLGYEAEGAGG